MMQQGAIGIQFVSAVCRSRLLVLVAYWGKRLLVHTPSSEKQRLLIYLFHQTLSMLTPREGGLLAMQERGSDL